MAITQSDRNVFVGGHITERAKRELELAAAKQNKSMSALLAEAIDLLLQTTKTEPEKP